VATNAARYGPNVPYKDQWGMIPFVAEAVQGRLDGALLWEQVNEHRTPLPKLVVAALAWATRWDVRWENGADFVFALSAAGLLAAALARTVRPHAPALAPWLVLLASQLTFSLTQGYNWTWGSLMPTYLATLATVSVAWTLAGFDGRWTGVVAMELSAIAAALSFGAGVTLLFLVPVTILLAPTTRPWRARVPQAAAGVGVAGLLTAIYFHGWHPRFGDPAQPFALAKVPQYLQFALAYLGSPIGARDVGESACWGAAGVALLAAGGGWLWWTSPAHRRALLPWLLLATYTMANAALTAFGRLQNGLHIALIARYAPTTALFPLGALVVGGLAIAALTRRARGPGIAAALLLVGALGVAAPKHYRASLEGVAAMRSLDAMLRTGQACVTTCAATSARCFLDMCWSAQVAAQMCPLMERLRFGLFAPR